MIIDWLSFNCANTKDNRERLENVFQIPRWNQKQFLSCKSVFDLDKTKKVFLFDMSSKSISNHNLENIKNFILLENFKIRRLDIAFDDKSNILNINEIWNLIQNRSFTAKFKKFNIIENFEFSKKRTYKGKTIYLGNRSSHTFLRIYDKLEQSKKIKKGEKLSDLKKRFKELKSISSWTRVEFEFKQANAQRIFERIIQEEWNPKHYLYKTIDLKNPLDKNKRTERRETVQFWKSFLEVTEKESLGLPEKYWSLETIQNWVTSQVSPTLYGLQKKLGKERLNEIIDLGEKRFEKIAYKFE
jgi:DNA relaxase NicK